MLVAEKRPDRKITGAERILDTLVLYSDAGLVKLEPKTTDIIRIGYTLSTEKNAFLGQGKPGIVYKESFGAWNFCETDSDIELNTSHISLCVRK